ncbi:MAG: hypothetical protein IPN42_16435 [Methylococcaceae bacterium]|nr:hypothetical protein [Methylococcaceae bacterium]
MNRSQTAVKNKPVPVFYIVVAVLAVMIISTAANMIFTSNPNESIAQYDR